MEHHRRHSTTDLQRPPTGIEKKETKTNPTTINQHQQSHQKKHHNRRFKKPKPPIINLSSHILTIPQITLLTKGLNFIPTPKKDHPAKTLQDILLFDRKLRLKYHFYQPNPPPNTITSNETNTLLNPSSGWTPPSGQDPFLDTYRSLILKEYLKELDKPQPKLKKNLKKQELKAMRELHTNRDIVIKPADKGGSIVIMNTTDYISEANRQLNDHNHYEKLQEDPTQKFNNHINYLIHQAWRLNIIEESTYINLQTKNPRIPTFYLLPKIHKKDNPGRPIVNGIGSPTEKISAYVDTYLIKYTPRIPSYIKDTTHLLNILKHQKILTTDIMVTIDVKSLYTNIPHTEGIAAITRMMEDTGLDTLKRDVHMQPSSSSINKELLPIQ